MFYHWNGLRRKAARKCAILYLKSLSVTIYVNHPCYNTLCQPAKRKPLKWVESTRHSRNPSAPRPHLGHDYHDAVGPGRVRLGDRLGLSRRESTALARIRTGHSPALRAWRHLIGQTDEDRCKTSGGEEKEDAEHLFTVCPAAARARHDIFGREDPTLHEVLADPRGVVQLLRRLGRL